MKRFIGIGILVLVLLVLPSEVWACPNCKSATDSGEWSNRGLNTGILYLMSVPYIALSLLGYFWWRQSRKNRETQEKLSAILKDKI